MPDDRTTYATEQEIEQLRTEIRQLREQGGERNGNSKQHTEEHGATQAKEQGKAGDKDEPQDQDQGADDEKSKKEKKPHPVRNAILIVAAVLLAVGGLIWWLHARNFESTDDAQVDAHISGIASRIAGTVVGVYVEENQFVKAGQVLIELDPSDYNVAVQEARSQLLQARAQTQAEQPNVPVTEVTNQTNIATAGADVASAEAAVVAAQQNYDAAVAKIGEAEANNVKAQADVERYRPLVEKDEIPRQQFDEAVSVAKAAAATVTANQATAAAALKQVDQRRAELSQAQSRAEEARKNAPQQIAIRQANVAMRRANAETVQARLKQAQLNLSYTKIVAPFDGVVAKRSAEVGQHVAPGQQLFLVSQISDMWVTANFRETQLEHMQPGQSVRIHADAFGSDFDGYIESLPAASGSVTSLLPPENATGNFVKVVQRLPVRIRFKEGQNGLDRLRPGMSVEPKVLVR